MHVMPVQKANHPSTALRAGAGHKGYTKDTKETNWMAKKTELALARQTHPIQHQDRMGHPAAREIPPHEQCHHVLAKTALRAGAGHKGYTKDTKETNWKTKNSNWRWRARPTLSNTRIGWGTRLNPY